MAQIRKSGRLFGSKPQLTTDLLDSTESFKVINPNTNKIERVVNPHTTQNGMNDPRYSGQNSKQINFGDQENISNQRQEAGTSIQWQADLVNQAPDANARGFRDLNGSLQFKAEDGTNWVSFSNIGGSGTVTSVGIQAGDLIDVSGSPVTTSGNITVNVDLSELADGTDAINGAQDELVYLDNGTQKRKQVSEIDLGQFNNDQSWTSNTGTVTPSSSDTLTNKTINGSNNTLSNIPNSALASSTISGVSLGGNLNNLTIGNGVQLNSGTTYNGSSAVTLSIQNSDSTISVGQGGISVDESNLSSIPNGALSNSSITIAGSAVSLGGSITADTIAGQISSDTITNAQLDNNTISGVALGNTLGTLTLGTGLSGTSYNGSGNVTANVDFGGASAGTYTNSTVVVNSDGQITGVSSGTAASATEYTVMQGYTVSDQIIASNVNSATTTQSFQSAASGNTNYLAFQINQGTNFSIANEVAEDFITVNQTGTYLVSFNVKALPTGGNAGSTWSGNLSIIKDDGAGSFSTVASSPTLIIPRGYLWDLNLSAVVVFSSGNTKRLGFNVRTATANGNALVIPDSITPGSLTITAEKIA